MRVLCVGNLYPPHDLRGGYEAVWAAAVEDLRSRGHQVQILCSDHRRPDEPADPEPDVHRELRWYWRDHEFPRYSLSECARIERHNAGVIDRLLDEHRPDVVSWWSMGGLSMGLLEQVRRRGVPAVAFVHDDWLDYGRRTDAWHRRMNRLPRPAQGVAERLAGVPIRCDFSAAARYVFVSRHTANHAAASGLDLADVGVAHSGIDPRLLDSPTDPGEWRWRLLYVGRVDERKGIRTAIDALASLGPEARLVIVGDGEPKIVQGLIEHAASRGVSERLELMGAQDPGAVRMHYDQADAVVFPVEWEEPWGLVPLEAMARSRPVVASGRGGSGDYLRDGENCLLAPAGDPAALAAAFAGWPRMRTCAGDSFDRRGHGRPAHRGGVQRCGRGGDREGREPVDRRVTQSTGASR